MTTKNTTAIVAAARIDAVAGSPWRRRTTTAKSTAITHDATTAISQGARASLPVPSVWITARGHAAYTAQWISRHRRGPTRSRNRLLAVTPATIHMDATPRPSQTGR